jgi:choloylglycine hydrolase
MAYVADGYPLYYDATNEKGLSIAGLNFPENSDYNPYAEDKDNITPFELIPWILGQCATVTEAEALLKRINLLKENFSDKLHLSPLHWIIADKERSITLESVKEGIKIYANPVGVLTNNPTFEHQIFNLNNYIHLSNEQPQNNFGGKTHPLQLDLYSNGMGGLGLPGDTSSMSRFVKAAFVKLNSVSGDSEVESVNQFFHILASFEMQNGIVAMGKDLYEKTIYSSCCNVDKGIYYYTTYENRAITAVSLHRCDLEGRELIRFPLMREQRIAWQN